MPLYEYRCKSCGRDTEVIQKFSDKPLTKCEKCGGKLEKLISQSGFVLKGGGWYKSGYESKPAATAKDGGDSPGSSSGSSEGEASAPASDGTAAKSDGAAAKSDGAAGSEPAAPAAKKKGKATAPAK